MLNYGIDSLVQQLAQGRHTLCLVGGGGKTTLLYELAQLLAARGRRVLVLTSTHILQPELAVYAANAVAVHRLWRQGRYAVLGTVEPGTGKLTAPPAALYAKLQRQAEVVLCEADGAKHLPCKVPAEHEPVLLEDCDIVVAVCGLDALGRPLKQACLRAELAATLLGIDMAASLQAEHLARILTEERGARKNVGSRQYYVLLNKCDVADGEQVQKLRSLLFKAGLSEEQVLLRTLPQSP